MAGVGVAAMGGDLGQAQLGSFTQQGQGAGAAALADPAVDAAAQAAAEHASKVELGQVRWARQLGQAQALALALVQFGVKS